MIDLIDYLVAELNEGAKKPGVMSWAGLRAERQCKRELATYFKLLAARVKMAHLEKLAGE